MDVLWAPWRMKYIEYAELRRGREGCFICEAAKAEDPSERLVLYKGERTILLMNAYPYNTGHLLAATTRHVPSLLDLTDSELLSLSRLLRSSIAALEKALKPHGFNIGINLGRTAGAGLEDHVHVHIVPRWSGDTNFMPVVANTKVIPEALRDTYRKILRFSSLIRE